MLSVLRAIALSVASVLIFVLLILRLPFSMLIGALRGSSAYLDMLRPYDEVFDIYNGRAAWEASIAPAPREAVLLYSLDRAYREVSNGGFWQFFANDTGVLAPEAAEGFRAIGMGDVGAVIEAAMVKLGTPYPFERAARERIVGEPGGEAYAHMFAAEDERFYTLAIGTGPFGGTPHYRPKADAYARALVPGGGADRSARPRM